MGCDIGLTVLSPNPLPSCTILSIKLSLLSLSFFLVVLSSVNRASRAVLSAILSFMRVVMPSLNMVEHRVFSIRGSGVSDRQIWQAVECYKQ